MAESSVARARRKKISALDLLTLVVLALAVALLARPGSPLRETVSHWLAQRRTARALERNWSKLATIATPLYRGPGEPQVIEFSDYECPFCRSAHASVDSAAQGGVRIAVVHFPLPSHLHARPAALAAVCAGQLGHFIEEDGYLMSTTAWQTDAAAVITPSIQDPAWKAAMDNCVRGTEGAALLSPHLALAESLEVAGTPTFLSKHQFQEEKPTARSLAVLAQAK